MQQLGKYQIHAELGRGAFATVYQTLDTTLDREVALKILHPALLTDPTFIDRFKHEARAMASLDHPHIATVYEIGETEERVYISLYLARGPNLGEALKDQGRFTWERTLEVLQPLCEALDYAHGKELVHRDLKPSNILLDSERGPLLTDFGFARLMGDSSVSLSLSGGILGTPAYIAPEVWELDAAKPPADIYALGCILYEMLTGEVLFAGKTPMQSMRAHDHGPQPPETWPEDVPPGIETVLNKALARDPAARYPSGAALWHALRDLDTQAQAARETAEQAAVTAQWRSETEAAMAAGEWRAAKMAAARWLALAPGDAAAQTAQRSIEAQLATVSAMQATPPQRADGQPVSMPAAVARPASAVGREQKSPIAPTLSGQSPKRKKLPVVLRIAGGGVLALMCVGLLILLIWNGLSLGESASVFVTNTPAPTRTPQPTATPAASAHTLIWLQDTYEIVIQHDETWGIQSCYCANTLDIRDFIAEANFYNPYSSARGDWDYGFFFRESVNAGAVNQYAIWVESSGKWVHGVTIDGRWQEDVAEGYISLHSDANQSNYLKLIVTGTKGQFWVNGKFVAELDLSALTDGRGVDPATGFVDGHKIHGEYTRIENFNVWSLDQ